MVVKQPNRIKQTNQIEKQALGIIFALLYNLNIRNTENVAVTMEFIQRYPPP